jgi:hypothetical protein
MEPGEGDPMPSTSDTGKTSIDSLIQELKKQSFCEDQIVPNGHRTFNERVAEYGLTFTRITLLLINPLIL